MTVKHSLKQRFQMSSELKAAWTNLVVLNVGNYLSLLFVYFCGLCAYSFNHFSGQEISRVADEIFIRVYYHSMVDRGLKEKL